MADQPRHTVVTACDHEFLWGALLLGISMRYQGMNCPFHVLAYDLPAEDVRILESIPNTRVFPTPKRDTRSICTQKPMAIASAETETIVWMDADCVVSGNLEKYFICPNNSIQIRIRGTEENATVFRNYYARSDVHGSIPSAVLKVWMDDVGDLRKSRIKSTFQTNCFVLNRSHLPFINQWQAQMEKVIPEGTAGVYNPKSKAYSMTDESVINSLLAYSSAAPATSEYLMDKDLDALCIHFGLKPKPWQHWTMQAFEIYSYIQQLLEWAVAQGVVLPPLPESFKPQNQKKEYKRAVYHNFYKELRYHVSSGVRAFFRLWRSG